MKTKIGILLVVLGCVLLAGSLGLQYRNRQEQQQAAAAVDVLMPRLVDAIHVRQEEPTEAATTAVNAAVNAPQAQTREMPVVEIEGEGYVGFVGIPALGLELPVMAEWSYPRLRKSPCRFSGDMYSGDLVIMAHNYERHFGGLKQLRVGDTVTVTDMDGGTIRYQVAALDILEPTAVAEMTAGEYDLTLFTCTYGGKSRVTVRCDRVAEEA